MRCTSQSSLQIDSRLEGCEEFHMQSRRVNVSVVPIAY